MPGTTLIDYALDKVKGFNSGLISWNMADIKNGGAKDSFADILVNKLMGTSTGRIFADVKISESHRYMSTVTDQTLEDGSSIHEHVIPQQPQVTLQIAETNNTIGSRFSRGFFGPQQTFNKLVELWENSVPLTVTTQHKQYSNMVIANMPILHTAPYRNALQISIDLRQLEFTKLETISYSGKTEGITKAASSNISAGLQKTQQFSSTAELMTRSLFGGGGI